MMFNLVESKPALQSGLPNANFIVSDGSPPPSHEPDRMDRDLYNNQMDDLNYAIDMLNGPKRFNLLLRGGVMGSIGRLWSDLNSGPGCEIAFSIAERTSPVRLREADPASQHHLVSADIRSVAMPKELRSQMSLMSMHLAMGMLEEPVDRVWVAIDDHLFLWDIADETEDVGFIDLQCIATHVDFCLAPKCARNPRHADIDKFLVVTSTNQMKIFEFKLFPTVCVLFTRPDEPDTCMYKHQAPSDQIITASCVSETGRIFYGVRDGRIFEVTLSFSSFWGCSCKAVELTGLGPGLLRSVLSPIFFSTPSEGEPRLGDGQVRNRRHVEQLSAMEDLLLVKRPTEVQCASLIVGSSWPSLTSNSLGSVRSYQTRALRAEFIPDAKEPFILLVTNTGSRLVLSSSDMQVVAKFPADIGLCSAAFIDCRTGVCLVQRQEDGLILHTDGMGAYQPLLDHGTLWALARRRPHTTAALEHSRLARPRMDFFFLTTNQGYLWTMGPAKEPVVENMSTTEVVIALADLLHPYWVRPLATVVEMDDRPFVSTMQSSECHQLKRVLDSLQSGIVSAKAGDLCHVVSDVIGCWHLLSVEHQLYAVMAHVADKYREELLMIPLKALCSASGRAVITALLNGLIQLYLDDRAATDALLVRLKLVSPKFFSSDAVLLAQASELLQKSAQCYSNGKYVVDRRNVWAKEAMNLLLRAAPSVDLELWAPALLKLGLCRELVRLTCLIAKTSVDPNDAALIHYLNNLTPQEDITGFQLLNHRRKLYNIMLNAACESEFVQQVQSSLLASQEDQLAHVALFDCYFDEQCSEEHCKEREGTEASLRLDDATLTRLSSSNYLEGYLQRRASVQERPEESTFALQSLCRLYELKGDHLNASDTYTRLATAENNCLDIAERISLLDKALLNARTVSSLKGSFNQQEQINARLMDIENYLDVAKIQARIAERIEAYAESTGRHVFEDLRKVRSTCGLLDFSTLFQHYAEPYELYDCQLAILSMVSHPDYKLVRELWLKISDLDLDNISQGTFRTSHVGQALATLQTTGRSIGPSGDRDDCDKYVPVDLIVRRLEMLDVPERSGKRLPRAGWSISLLSKQLKLSVIIKSLQETLGTPVGMSLIAPIFDIVNESGDLNSVTVLTQLLARLISGFDDGEELSEGEGSEQKRMQAARHQKLNTMLKSLERKRQHLLFC